MVTLFGGFPKLRKAAVWFLMSVSPSFSLSLRPFACLSFYPSAWKKLASSGRIFMKFDI